MRMKRIMLALATMLVCLTALPAVAGMCESIGEYEYTYGDAESIMSAKQRCENMAIRAAIEQCAVFVSSTTNIENYELKNDLVNTLAAALVKQKRVLEHRVEGRTIYYRVSIKLDDEQMTRAIEAEQRRQNPEQLDLEPESNRMATPTPVTTAREEAPVVQPQAAAQPRAEEIVKSTAKPIKEPRRTSGSRNLTVQFGQKSLKKDDWDPLEKQGFFGLHFDTGLGAIPLNLSFDLAGSAKTEDLPYYDDEGYEYSGEAEGQTSELGVGLRYYLPVAGGKLRPFVGVGGCYISASTKEKIEDFDVERKMEGSALGYVFDAGLMIPLGHFLLGVDWRMSSAKVKMKGDDFFGYELEWDMAAGGTAISAVLGFTW